MKNLLIALVSVCLFWSCGGGSKTASKAREGKGGVFIGGILKLNEEEYLKSLYPPNITEVTGQRIDNNIYEGLVRFNVKTLAIEPCIAKSWDISDGGKKFVFHLRSGIKFTDDPCFPDGKGRTLTAKDIKYCFDRISYSKPTEIQAGWLFKDLVVGANEYTEKTAKDPKDNSGVSGIVVLDDSTLEISLTKPFSVFIDRLALPQTAIYAKEAYEKYGSDMRTHCVGTGPFKIKALKENELVFLERNPDYWEVDEFGNKLPYLDFIKITFIKEKKAELEAFKKGDIDLIYRLPLEMKEEVVDVKNVLRPAYSSFELQFLNSLTIQYYGFLHPGKIFNDKRVRQAFCYAVDREKIATFTYKGSGVPAKYGFVPPGCGTYDPTKVKGYTFDPVKAQGLLAAAGFPKGAGFPKVTLQINSGGGRNAQIAEAIQKMIQEVLNIKVEILTVPWAQHSESIESAKTEFYRLGWVADYPDPENFLNLFDSKYVPEELSTKTYINSFRYKNPEFDKWFRLALATPDEKLRNEYYAKADQIVIDDAVVLPITYDIDYRILQKNLKGCPQNPIEHRDFRRAYKVPK
ncbi:MAG: ABC transporter substrate-binding protein [Bacteroidetes bacterium]|nr:ABC transporter substrate-binding protein [Bacteroidota bacterium]